jgi:mannitol-specific phosphotransferase system IIBC component
MGRHFLLSLFMRGWHFPGSPEEILQDLPDVDTILVPVGGAGLISGVGIASFAAIVAYTIVKKNREKKAEALALAEAEAKAKAEADAAKAEAKENRQNNKKRKK